MSGGFVGRIVPAQVVVAVGEIDVFLVEDCGPLEGCLRREEVSVW